MRERKKNERKKARKEYRERGSEDKIDRRIRRQENGRKEEKEK